MEDNHHQEQHQPKFNNNPFPSFNPHHSYQLNHHQLPFGFQQWFLSAATPPQGFSLYAHNNQYTSFPTVPQQPPQRLRIHQDQENVSCSTSVYIPPSPAALPFSRDPDRKNGGFCSVGGGGGGDGLLRGNLALDTRRETGGSHYGGWQNLEDSSAITIRQPLRKPFSHDNGNETRVNDMKDKEMEQQPSDQLNGNKIFCELQEFCRNATSAAVAGSGNNRDDGGLVETFDAATTATAALCLPPNNTSEDTKGDELPSKIADADDEENKQKKIRDDEMSSIALFFEGLVYQVMEHQKKCMEAIDKLDQERKERERVWRQKELERLEQEAALRANERALASQREATLISYLEKITGQSIQLPSNLIELEETRARSRMGMRVSLAKELRSRSSRGGVGDDLGSVRLMKNRWPPVEVDALIQIRMSLEKKFQGPGYKGPLWEEISNLMASMGYHRPAKRCKEKWENINKYFKRYKENSSSNHKLKKKMNKTCRYFDQLDHLYSKSSGLDINDGSNSCSSSSEHRHQPVNNPFSDNGNGITMKQNEAFVSPGNLIKTAGPSIEELKQGSIIQRIDEGQHPRDFSVEDMEEDEEVEEGHGNGNDKDTSA